MPQDEIVERTEIIVPIALTAVAFDHGVQAGPRYSAPLRFNEFQPVNAPEWRRGNLGPSFAAYVRQRLPPVAFILARFASVLPPGTTVEIRALTTAQSTAGIPNLPPTLITFGFGGDSGWRLFPLDTNSLAQLGVGKVSFQWTWQFRPGPAEPWSTFDQSSHRIYLLLSPPTEPWSTFPGPFNQTAPWINVLEIACEWAAGAQDTIAAASLITKAVNDLGGSRFTYDAAVGAPHYTVLGVPRFLVDAFIDRLLGGPGAGPLVNCSDCATIVSTFANILGCDLWQSKMGLVTPPFGLNPIRSIGFDNFTTLNGAFTFHEVAWSGDCTEFDTVYDACLHTDADVNPTAAPHSAFLPVNQLFGRSGSGNYRDQLAAPQDRDICVPQPGLRIRRSLLSQTTPFATPSPGALNRAAEARLDVAAADLSPPESDTEYFFEGFKFFGTEFPGWMLSRVEQYASSVPQAAPADVSAAASFVRASKAESIPRVLVSWWQTASRSDSFLRIETFDAPSTADARALLLRIAREVESPRLERFVDEVGELAFATPEKEFVMFVRGNHVHVVRDVAKHAENVVEQAEYLDDWLIGAGVPVTITARLNEPAAMPTFKDTGNTWKRLVLRRTKAQRSMDALFLQPVPDAGASITEELVGPGHAPPRDVLV